MSAVQNLLREYKKVKKIGAGSYGKVTLYESVAEGELVAIKKLSLSRLRRIRVCKGVSAYDDAMKEASVLLRLSHPNVIRLIRVIRDGDISYKEEGVRRGEGLKGGGRGRAEKGSLAEGRGGKEVRRGGESEWLDESGKMEREGERWEDKDGSEENMFLVFEYAELGPVLRISSEELLERSRAWKDILTERTAHSVCTESTDFMNNSTEVWNRTECNECSVTLAAGERKRGGRGEGRREERGEVGESPEGAKKEHKSHCRARGSSETQGIEYLNEAKTRDSIRRVKKDKETLETKKVPFECVVRCEGNANEGLREATASVERSEEERKRVAGAEGEEWIKEMVKGAITGLMYLHENKIVHGDVKPENLLLAKNGKLKISDFGNCHEFKDENDWLVRSPGTPVFFAPECCTGNPYHGIPADVWSLGVTLFVLAFSVFPFFGETEEETYSQILHGVLHFPHSHYDIHPDLQDLLATLLHRDPKQRITLQAALSHKWLSFPPSLTR